MKLFHPPHAATFLAKNLSVSLVIISCSVLANRLGLESNSGGLWNSIGSPDTVLSTSLSVVIFSHLSKCFARQPALNPLTLFLK